VRGSDSWSKIAKVIDSRDRYLRHLTDGIIAFWIEHGPDTRHGGFEGGLDRKGHPIPSRPRSLVQHARFLWSFSAAYRLDPRPTYREMADRSLSFLRERFYDPLRLGWYYLVSAEGLPLNRQKHLYGQSYVIYGLSEYFLAFGDEEALRLALDTFGVIDRFGHDGQWRGYRESFSEAWRPIPQHPDYGVSGDQKTMNTHLHLLESFTNLYRASQDATVKSRLEELIDVCANTIIDARRGCALQYFEPDWTPLPSPISYGHDIELSWLLAEAGDACGIRHASSIRELSLLLARAVARNGLDRENGGVFYEADPTGTAPGNRRCGGFRQRHW
jgi:mannobiose 2-epimerase